MLWSMSQWVAGLVTPGGMAGQVTPADVVGQRARRDTATLGRSVIRDHDRTQRGGGRQFAQGARRDEIVGADQIAGILAGAGEAAASATT
jgi:hypothetical protein